MGASAGFLIAPADSARVVGDLYGVSLLASLPLLVALVTIVALRRAGAGVHTLAWRGALVAVLAIFFGRLLPFHWMAWVVPEGLAAPLVALGRAQLAVVESLPASVSTAGTWRGSLVQGLLALYGSGVGVILLLAMRGQWRLRRMAASAERCDRHAWEPAFRESARRVGLSESQQARLRLVITDAAIVPMTWGTWRPVIVLPSSAQHWSPAQQRAALVHELWHMQHNDALFALLARVACALYWFHPGVWWAAARLRDAGEQACDDRVLLSGVRRSDYAELLGLVAGGRLGGGPVGSMSLVRRSGLRTRLAAIVDTRRALRAPSRLAFTAVALLSVLAGVPVGTVRVAPTREVLTSLMRDPRWESRAYAVVRLAQRADSVEVARDAARHDPNPRVRAWAQFALARDVGAGRHRAGGSDAGDTNAGESRGSTRRAPTSITLGARPQS